MEDKKLCFECCYHGSLGANSLCWCEPDEPKPVDFDAEACDEFKPCTENGG